MRSRASRPAAARSSRSSGSADVVGLGTLSPPSLRAQRSNPDCRRGEILDCFATLAMTRATILTACHDHATSTVATSGSRRCQVHDSNSMRTSVHSLAASMARALRIHRPRNDGGRREGRAPTAPMVACNKHAVVTTGTSRTSGLPCAMSCGLYVISPGTGFLAPVTGAMLSHRRRLDASIGAPGPHDFAVRMMPFVRARKHTATSSRPPHPAPDVRDDAYVPLVGQDGAEYAHIPKKRNREIFRERAGQVLAGRARRANHLAHRQ
jgi:hypothetical protein